SAREAYAALARTRAADPVARRYSALTASSRLLRASLCPLGSSEESASVLLPLTCVVLPCCRVTGYARARSCEPACAQVESNWRADALPRECRLPDARSPAAGGTRRKRGSGGRSAAPRARPGRRDR